MDGLRFSGRVITRYKNPVTGEVIPGSEQVNNNMLLDIGAIDIVKWLANDSPKSAGAFKYIALGSDTTAVAHGQTGLLAEYTGVGTYVRVLGAQTTIDEVLYPANGKKVYQVTANFLASSGLSAVGELALYDAISGGNSFIRAVFSPVRDNQSNTLEVTYQLTVAPQ